MLTVITGSTWESDHHMNKNYLLHRENVIYDVCAVLTQSSVMMLVMRQVKPRTIRLKSKAQSENRPKEVVSRPITFLDRHLGLALAVAGVMLTGIRVYWVVGFNHANALAVLSVTNSASILAALTIDFLVKGIPVMVLLMLPFLGGWWQKAKVTRTPKFLSSILGLVVALSVFFAIFSFPLWLWALILIYVLLPTAFRKLQGWVRTKKDSLRSKQPKKYEKNAKRYWKLLRVLRNFKTKWNNFVTSNRSWLESGGRPASSHIENPETFPLNEKLSGWYYTTLFIRVFILALCVLSILVSPWVPREKLKVTNVGIVTGHVVGMRGDMTLLLEGHQSGLNSDLSVRWLPTEDIEGVKLDTRGSQQWFNWNRGSDEEASDSVSPRKVCGVAPNAQPSPLLSRTSRDEARLDLLRIVIKCE